MPTEVEAASIHINNLRILHKVELVDQEMFQMVLLVEIGLQWLVATLEQGIRLAEVMGKAGTEEFLDQETLLELKDMFELDTNQ